jgi:hypothetical protein
MKENFKEYWLIYVAAGIAVITITFLATRPKEAEVRVSLPPPTNGAYEPGTVVTKTELSSVAKPVPPFVKPTVAILSHRELSTIDIESLSKYDEFPFSPVIGENVWYETLGSPTLKGDLVVVRDIALDKIIAVDFSKELAAERERGTEYRHEKGSLRAVHTYEGSGFLPEENRVLIKQFTGTNFYSPTGSNYMDTVLKLESGEIPLPKTMERTTEGQPPRDAGLIWDRKTSQFIKRPGTK